MTNNHALQDFIHKPGPLSASQDGRRASSKIRQVWHRTVARFHKAFSNDMAVDLGTSNTVIYVPDEGVVLNEPSIIAFNDRNQIVAVGREAKLALGRQASAIRIVRPLKDGVIADFDAAESMLAYFIKCALTQRRFSNPRILICAPGEVSPVERRALEDAAGRAGAKYVDVIEEPIAAAIGAGFDIQSGNIFMLIDIGGGTTDIAVLGYGGPVHLSTLQVGGNKMDEAIIQHVRRHHCIEIGELTAEAIKLELGPAGPKSDDEGIEVRGRNLKTGLPAAITITDEEVRSALEPIIGEMIQGLCLALEELSPEVAAGLLGAGVVLTGGASRLSGLAERISREIGIEARPAASDVQSVAVLGVGRLLQDGSYTSIQEMMTRRRAEQSRDRGQGEDYPVNQAA